MMLNVLDNDAFLPVGWHTPCL